MFFCVICSCCNDFRYGISVNGKVHLILYCREEIFCNLTIKGIVNIMLVLHFLTPVSNHLYRTWIKALLPAAIKK